MEQSGYGLPLPTPQPETEYFWERAKAHELWLMACDDCRATYFYPRPICPRCFSRKTHWVQSSGRGTLYAFAMVHRAPTRAFQDRVPFVAALVELEGGVRVPSNLVEVEPDPERIEIGMPVEAVFDDVTPEVTLVKFRPVSG